MPQKKNERAGWPSPALDLLLREQGKLSLDDPIGRHVGGLHKDLAGARIAELLSHGGGVTRDGEDSGQFADRRPSRNLRQRRKKASSPPRAGAR